MTVYVESNVVEERVVKEDESFQETKQKLVVCGKGNTLHFNRLCTYQKSGAWSCLDPLIMSFGTDIEFSRNFASLHQAITLDLG